MAHETSLFFWKIMQQHQALDILKSGHNVFLTGQAGSGKTYTLLQYINYLRTHEICVAITASTGIAATHLNGMTIHAWAGIGIAKSIDEINLSRARKNNRLNERLRAVRVLIIDEISMLHQDTLLLVHHMLCAMRDNDLPFGGVQVVFCGDFFQLPPIGTGENRDKYAFMGAAWQLAAPVICYLSEQHRQTDALLPQILNEIRQNRVSSASIEHLKRAKWHNKNEDATQLFTHNADVDTINQTRLDAIDGSAVHYRATYLGDSNLHAALKKGVRAPELLTLKIGARVMFVKNMPDKNVMNGTLGTVVTFNDEGDPVIKTRDDTLTVQVESWSVLDNQGEVLAEYVQLPLCLAWAITVHKSQGMTLTAAQIDLTRTFERGQGYVALSRLRDFDGLWLKGFNHISLEVDPLVIKADARFLALSAEAAANLDALNDKTVISHIAAFIKRCGAKIKKPITRTPKPASTHANTPKKHAKAVHAPSSTPSSAPSYAVSAQLLKAHSIEQVANIRGLAHDTIMRHLSEYLHQNPEIWLDYTHLFDVDTLNLVYQSYQKSDKNIIKEAKIDARDVRLAMICLKAKGMIDDCH